MSTPTRNPRIRIVNHGLKNWRTEVLDDLGSWDITGPPYATKAEALLYVPDVERSCFGEAASVECLAWYGDRAAGGATCHRPKGHPSYGEDGIGHATEPLLGDLTPDQLAAEIVRAARGLVRTAHPDVGQHEVVRQWWDALVAAVEQLSS